MFPAHILESVERKLGVDLYDAFDMIAGTSTGSIIAAAVACKVPSAQIVSMYREHGTRIFKPNSGCRFWPRKVRPGVQSMYEDSELRKVLDDAFKDTLLGDISKPLLLPSTDIGNGGVHVFKSGYSVEFTRDRTVPVKSAVLASCAAPVYFDPVTVENYLLADGGVWANNPGLAAVIDARYRLRVPLEDIRVLSLGTGESATAYGTTPRRWGLLNGWKNIEFIAFLLSLQAQSTHNYLKLMLGKHQLVRLNFKTDKPLPMDDPSIISDLVSRADRAFTHASAELMEFFDIQRGENHALQQAKRTAS